jgi:Flp pilus assembly protein TadB
VKRVGSTVSEKVGGMDIDKALVLLHAALALAIVVKQTRSRKQPRKAEPFRSAMSVLNYYLNEGRELSETQRATLEDIKEELRMVYNRNDDEMISPAGS